MGDRRFNHQQRTALYLAQDGRCALCDKELTPGWHADHVAPWSVGGETDVVNGQALCPTCNLKKGKKEPMGERKPLRKWQREGLERYDQHQGKSFLVEATMGAGKSRFIAEVVQREHAQNKADAFVIVVPQAALRNQMADDFHVETGIQLNPKWGGQTPLIDGEYKGIVVTYAWLASFANASLLRRATGRQPTLIVLDEVHHAREESSWGNSAHEAFDHASRLVLTTGTPFRSDGRPIPWVTYDKEGRSIPDYAYTYGQAIGEEEEDVVRYLNFLHQDGTMEWLNEDGRQKATFADKVNKRGESERLRTSLLQDGKLAGELIANGMKDVNELRENDPDAAVLVITMDQDHAKDIANRIRKEHGVTPPVAISEDPDAADIIKRFKESQEPCIVSVRMISEGVNIPRIRVIIYLTNVVAELSFKQIMGRAMRVEPGHNDHNAWIHLPDDGRLRKLARGMQDESDAALRERITKESPERDAEQPSIFFIPDSAVPGDVQATVNGVPISVNEFAYATSLKKANHKAAKGIAPALIALSFKLANLAVPDVQQLDEQKQTQTEPQPEEKPYYQRIEDAKRLNNKLTGSLVARLCRTKSVKYSTTEYQEMYKKVNIRLNAAAKIGYSGVSTCNDLEKLRLRYNLLVRWIKDNIAPEEPYND